MKNILLGWLFKEGYKVTMFDSFMFLFEIFIITMACIIIKDTMERRKSRKKIKTIREYSRKILITKEQFKNIEYKVEE